MQCVGSVECWGAHRGTEKGSGKPDDVRRQHGTVRDTRTGHADEAGGGQQTSQRSRKRYKRVCTIMEDIDCIDTVT